MKNEARKVVAGSLLGVALLLAASRPAWLQQKMYPQNAALRHSLRGVTEARLARDFGDSALPVAVLKGREAQELADNLEIAEVPSFTSVLGVRMYGNICLDPGAYSLRFYRRQKQVADFTYSFGRNELGHDSWRGFKTLEPDSKRRLNALLHQH